MIRHNGAGREQSGIGFGARGEGREYSPSSNQECTRHDAKEDLEDKG